MTTILGRDWHRNFANILGNVDKKLLLISPYVTEVGIRFVAANLRKDSPQPLQVQLFTNLSPNNVMQGATDPDAILSLASEHIEVEVTHLPQLHAKVYIADQHSAVITSANLTAGGLYRNREAGVGVDDIKLIADLKSDYIDYGGLGVKLQRDDLKLLCQVSASLKAIRAEAKTNRAQREVHERIEDILVSAQGELIRLKLAGGTVADTFTKTIQYLLKRHGPLGTKQMHPLIQAIHPDICDDSVDRVVANQHFGKKWKHAVRSAQQQLKSQRRIQLREGKWQIINN